MKRGFYWSLAAQNIKSHRRVYLPYLLSATGTALMFYIILSLAEGVRQSPGMIGQGTLTVMLSLGTIVIGVFSVLFLFYTNSFIIKRRKKELGLYNILGMEKFHISKVIFRETLISALIVIVGGLGLGVLFSKMMFLALERLLQMTVPIVFVIPPTALAATAVFFLAIFFATMLYNILQGRLNKPIELLHGNNAGEKEPKAHWLLAVLGALLLGAGYYLAVSITDPVAALGFFFVAVILVILGTYLLFITGITALLKLLKKNKKFYYQSNHFTTVSGMLYRMKQNAAGLASICILFTCLLVTVSTTFSLYTGMDDLVRTRFPRNISLRLYQSDKNPELEEHVKAVIEEESEKLGFSPVNVIESTQYGNFALYRSGTQFVPEIIDVNCSPAVLTLYGLDDFNRFTGRNELLKEREVLLIDPEGKLPENGELSIYGQEFSYRRIEQDVVDGTAGAMLAESYYIVLPNHETAVRLLTEYYDGDENGVHTTYYYQFDIDGEREDIYNVRWAIDSRLQEDSGAQSIEDRMHDGGDYNYYMEDSSSSYNDFFSLYGGLFFLGLFLGFLFLMGTAMIIYYKQVSEGYEDVRRFTIMQQVGMSNKEVKRSIHSQIILVFFLPLVTAVLHLGFAFPMLQKILMMMNLQNFDLLLWSTIGCVAFFVLIYTVIYLITARTYYKIVQSSSDRKTA